MMDNFTKCLFIVAMSFLWIGARAQTCPGGLGMTVNISSLPYNGINLTTCGAGNEITSSNATVCGSGSYYGGEDLVFIFTPTASGSITISITSSSSWIGMMLYNGCPFLGQGGACVGNVQSSTGSKTLTVSLTAGVTYYLVVDTWPTPTCIPNFSLSIPAPTSSDPCSSITTLTCGTAVSATPTGAGLWNVTTCGFSTPGQEKVYSFTPTTTGVYNLQVNSVSGGYIDYFYKAASGGCNSSGWTCIDDINFTGTFPIGTLTAGVQYYFLLDPEGTGAYNHNFQIVCPAADPCASVTTLACATSATATLVGTGVWNNSTCGFSTPGQEKVYSFTPTTTGVHTLQVTSASGTGYIDYQYKAASGGCSATGWTCIDDINFVTTVTIGTLTAGVQYYILLDAESTTSSTQTFQINCPSAPDPCAGITTLACATSTTATLTGSGAWNLSGTYPNNSCGFSTPGQEKVYTFTPTITGVHTLQVTSSSGSYIDYFFKAASGGCNNTGWTCIDDISIASTVTIGTLTAGVQYYILLDAESTSSVTHTFQINCPVPDPCSSITILVCATSESVTLTGTGTWNNNTCGFSTPGNEKVYSFTPTVTGVHNLQVTSSSGSYIDYMYKAASGGCSSSGWTCIDDISIAGTYTIGTLTAGVQYYLLLDPETTSSVSHTFQINCPAAIPSCLAAPTAPANGASFCLPGPGTLSWPSAPNATSYDVYFGTSPTPPFVTNTTNTSYSTGSLVSGTYYWQIRPANASGTASGCPIWSFTVDITPPTISNCPNNQFVLKNASCVATLPNYTGVPTTNDNCPGGVTVSQSPAPGTVLNSTVTVTLTATDAAGNTATCSFTATPVDQTPPSISNCPNNQNVLKDASCVATLPDYTSVPTLSDNCPGIITVIQTPASSTLTGTITVTLTAFDVAGNSSQCSFTATPVDQTAPALSNCPGNQNASVDGNCQGVLANYTAGVNASDNCPGVGAVVQSPAPGTIFTGTTVVTLSATDASNNTGTCSFTVQVADNTQPTIQCTIGTISVSANANCQYVVPSLAFAVNANDNCGTPTISQSPAVGATIGLGTTLATLTATDGNGNSASCNMNIQVTDQTAPTITCPATQTLAVGVNCQASLPNYTSLGIASDNCTSPTKTQSPAVGTTFGLGNTTVTLTATDGVNLSSSCTFTVSVVDQTAPSIICPGTQTVAANASCQATLANYVGLGFASDNCTASPTKTQSPVAGTTLALGATMVTLTATDGAGLTGTCTFNVSVLDLTPPSISCPGTQTLAVGANCQASLPNYTALALATDNCTASPTKTQSPAAGILVGPGTITVNIIATDGASLSSSCSFSVSVVDQTAPSITCPGNITQGNTPGFCGANVSFANATATDNCLPAPTVTNLGQASGSFFAVGTTAVIFSATDGSNNSSTCSFTITVNDTQAPTITCPSTQTVAANASCQATLANYTGLGAASDNCTANPTKVQSPSAGTTLSLGTTVVTLQATDGVGLTGSCTFNVVVADQTAPSISCPGAQTLVANASCQAAVPSYTGLGTASDNCTANPTKTQSPVAGSFIGLGASVVTLIATDAAGLTGTCTFSVTVLDQSLPTITCPSNATRNTDLNQCNYTAIGTEFNANATDNCSVASRTYTLTGATTGTGATTLAGIDFQRGITTVNWKATDGSGNMASCSFTVTVNDAQAPSITCPSNQNIPASATCSGTVGTWSPVALSDNCTASGLITVTQTPPPGTVLTGHNDSELVTLTANDGNGNFSSCSFTVTLKDVSLPVAKCRNAIANLGPNGTVTVSPSAVNNGSTDNCSFTLSLSPNTFNCSNIGMVTVTLQATDAAGNSSTCTAKVTVRDASGPVAKCKNPTIFLNDLGQATLSVSQVDNGSTDNCGIATMNISQTQFSCAELAGSSWPVTLNLTDVNGNVSSCLSYVTVKDAIAPTAICEDVTVQLGQNGYVLVYSADLAYNSFDNCSVWSYSPTSKVYTTANIGNNNLTITAKDWSNNGSTCVSVVTVLPFNGLQSPPPGASGNPSGNDFADFAFALYPNPTSGDVSVAFELPADQKVTLRVFDMQGRVILSRQEEGLAGENTLSLRLEDIPAGLYMVDFQSADLKAQRRLMVQE